MVVFWALFGGLITATLLAIARFTVYINDGSTARGTTDIITWIGIHYPNVALFIGLVLALVFGGFCCCIIHFMPRTRQGWSAFAVFGAVVLICFLSVWFGWLASIAARYDSDLVQLTPNATQTRL